MSILNLWATQYLWSDPTPRYDDEIFVFEKHTSQTFSLIFSREAAYSQDALIYSTLKLGHYEIFKCTFIRKISKLITWAIILAQFIDQRCLCMKHVNAAAIRFLLSPLLSWPSIRAVLPTLAVLTLASRSVTLSSCLVSFREIESKSSEKSASSQNVPLFRRIVSLAWWSSLRIGALLGALPRHVPRDSSHLRRWIAKNQRSTKI